MFEAVPDSKSNQIEQSEESKRAKAPLEAQLIVSELGFPEQFETLVNSSPEQLEDLKNKIQEHMEDLVEDEEKQPINENRFVVERLARHLKLIDTMYETSSAYALGKKMFAELFDESPDFENDEFKEAA